MGWEGFEGRVTWKYVAIVTFRQILLWHIKQPMYRRGGGAYTVYAGLIFLCPCFANIIPNYNQQDATFLDLFISTDALHVSDRSSAHHQEHITVHTDSGSVSQCCCYRRIDGSAFRLIHDNIKQHYRLTLPEAVCTVMCSWWWAEEPPEICRASVEINKLRNVASFWL